MSLRLVSAVLLCVAATAYGQPHVPRADANAIITDGHARFTILTSRLVRMEWSADRTFEDRASLVFLNRKLPVPAFTSKSDGDWLILSTKDLTLRYRRGSGAFTADNLSITFTLNGTDKRWTPGMKDEGNLLGTTRTLDGVKGATKLEPGLVSRDGWTLVDDSQRPLFDTSDWPWVTPRPAGERQDWYFFGYGHAYREALYDFTQVAGKIPLPPRFAFGLWWSRYWAYTDEEFKQLVTEFETHDVPLDVLVIDMDWHQTFDMRWSEEKKDQAGQTLGWTGYTWDSTYFPNPGAFLDWCQQRGLKTPLNLHPASGIQPHEVQYPAMARAMGIDPATNRYVPFDITDKKFATNYMDLVIHPLEKLGVDFWWLDWQQWGTTKIPGVTPTWWLNYVFFTHMERQGTARPLLFHRWGGLGNHRYQIGFSGDAISVWESLKFQPYFTATAANVGFGYWSHDIGGHMPGAVTPELYTRWIQWGAFSPIIRTHTTKNPGSERRIWAYPTEAFLTMRDAIKLRYALIPYLYTSAREAYDTGVAMLRPLYYDHPQTDEAYTFTGQYLYGSQMMVAPITSPVDSVTMLTWTTIWIPPGEWVDWFTGGRFVGPKVIERSYAMDEIPVFLKAGAIVPMQEPRKLPEGRNADPLVLQIFPGKSGEFTVYEDAGNTNAYRGGEWASVRVSDAWSAEKSFVVTIDPVKGSYPGMPMTRSYEFRIAGVLPSDKINCNGVEVAKSPRPGQRGWWYDGPFAELRVRTGDHPTDVPLKLEVQHLMALPEKAADLRGRLARFKRVMPILNNLWPQEWSPVSLVRAAQTGNRMALWPEHAAAEVEAFEKAMPKVVQDIEAMRIPDGVKAKALGHLK